MQSAQNNATLKENNQDYKEITIQSIQRMQILHRGIFMPAFDRILQLARMEEMDCEFVEVTAHEGARPTHAVWQGGVYHRGGAVVKDGERYDDFETATGYGTGPGLCGWNCRHNFYPFYPGVSVRNYTDERLAGLDARDIPYGGGLFARHSNTGQTTGIMRVIPPRMTNARHPRSASAIGLVLRYCCPVRLLSSSRSTKTKTPAGVRRVLLFWWS